MGKRKLREFEVDSPLAKCYKTKYDASFPRKFLCYITNYDFPIPEFIIIDEDGKLISCVNTNDPWIRTIFDTNNPFSRFTENIWKCLIKYLDLESIFNFKITCSLINLVIPYILGLLEDEENHRNLFIEALDWGESWEDLEICENKNNSDTFREIYNNDLSRQNFQFVPIHIDVTFVGVYSAVEGVIALDNNGNLWKIDIDLVSHYNYSIKESKIVLKNVISVENDYLAYGNCIIIINKLGEIYLHGFWLNWDECRNFELLNCDAPYFHVLMFPHSVIFYDDDANFQLFGIPVPFLTNFIQEKKQYLPIQSYTYSTDRDIFSGEHDYLYPACTLLLDSSNSLWHHDDKGEWHHIKFEHLIHSVVWLSLYGAIFILGHCGKLWQFINGENIVLCADNIHNIFAFDGLLLAITNQGSLYQYNTLHQLEYQYPYLKPLTNFPASISSKSARK